MCLETESKTFGEKAVCVARLWINYGGDRWVIWRFI